MSRALALAALAAGLTLLLAGSAPAEPVTAPTPAAARDAAAATGSSPYLASRTTLRRVRQALLAPGADAVLEGDRLPAMSFDVQVIGDEPARPVLDGTDLRLTAPAPHGPPVHGDFRWLWAPWPGARSMVAAGAGWHLSW